MDLMVPANHPHKNTQKSRCKTRKYMDKFRVCRRHKKLGRESKRMQRDTLLMNALTVCSKWSSLAIPAQERPPCFSGLPRIYSMSTIYAQSVSILRSRHLLSMATRQSSYRSGILLAKKDSDRYRKHTTGTLMDALRSMTLRTGRASLRSNHKSRPLFPIRQQKLPEISFW